MTQLGATIPTSPLVYDDGNIRPEWRAFFTGIWMRTGGAIGISSDTSGLEAQLNAEEAARKQGDVTLGAEIQQETAARSSADATETAARQSADSAETTARKAADALLVPIAQQCTLWSQCNFTFLPTSDPGHGMPWLNGNVVTVGTSPGTVSALLLEDASGDWMLETGGAGNDWQWG